MFESIIEKILQDQFGKYLEGIDKDNLHLGVILVHFFIYRCGLETFSWKMSPFVKTF